MAVALDEIEFASALEKNPIDVAGLCESMGAMYADGKTKQVDTWLDKLLDKLTEQKDALGGIAALKHAANWSGQVPSFKAFCKERLDRMFREDEDSLKLVNAAAFGNVRLRAQECLRRLEVLFGFEGDVKCHDKTWGFGIVKSVLMDDGKVMIDFVEKPGHLMSLAYAAESVKLVDDDHLLARKHANPDEVAHLVAKEPAEVVRIALRSFGPKPAQILQEILVPDVVPESRWKRFWEVARKELKADPLVVMPAKRKDPIELLQIAKAFDDDWFANLAADTDMNHILIAIGEYLEQDTPEGEEESSITEEHKNILNDRLALVVRGAQKRYPDLTVKAILVGREIDSTPEDIQAAEFVQNCFEVPSFLSVNERLHAKERKEFLRYLLETNEEEALNLYQSVLNQVEYNTLNEMIGLLMDHGREEAVAEDLRKGWNSWSSNVFQLRWFVKNLERVEEDWNFGNRYDLVTRMLADIENEYHGDENSVQGQLKKRFEDDKWLKQMYESFDERQRRTVTTAVKNSTGWSGLDNNGILGQIVKIDPTMSQIVSGKSEAKDGELRRGPVLSHRRYNEKKARLQHIERNEIPENSKEIATAREYGDLRENFEYHAAKDKQRLLLQEKEELIKELANVTPSDFSTFPTDLSGVGTGVTIQYTGGERKTFFILGVADSEEDLGIISTNSPMAKSLTGFKPGDEIMVPSLEGEVPATVKEVTGLSAKVREWVGQGDEVEMVAVEPVAPEE